VVERFFGRDVAKVRSTLTHNGKGDDIMRKRVLITGGAGFIGSHLADDLLTHGYDVRVFDNLCSQVHGPERKWPSYLHNDVELVRGDVLDSEALSKALVGINAVFHFAAMVGVGQSMYEVRKYTEANNLGTATLMETLIASPVERLVIASSMSIYGEGLYKTIAGDAVSGSERSTDQLQRAEWELRTQDGRILTPIPTPESKPASLASVYALSKYDQEVMCLMLGGAYHIPTTALRFFNVYGPRQALSNPYTGVLAIFASRLMNGNAPLIFEDGYQCRDFVSVYDVAHACRLALEKPEAVGQVFNVGSGIHYTIREIAERTARVLGKEDIRPQITNRCRRGDIRHCFADVSKARRLLGYEPRVSFEEGLADTAACRS
jgi:dTDP-L-rhamnose 4-epimerase